jgi:hypothetical protein
MKTRTTLSRKDAHLVRAAIALYRAAQIELPSADKPDIAKSAIYTAVEFLEEFPFCGCDDFSRIRAAVLDRTQTRG